jgi:zinc transport system substrate-binding protein
MRKTFYNLLVVRINLTLLLLTSLLSVGCRQASVNTRKDVSVSILPQRYIVERIAGNLFHVSVLMPPGANHETYEPTPQVMKSLAVSGLYFAVGWLDFEKSWMPRFAEMYPEMKIVNTSDGGQLIKASETGHKGHDAGIDPHTWLSPRFVKLQASIITAALTQMDPAHRELFTANLSRFHAQLDSMDAVYTALFAEHKGRKFLIYHPSLGYFARDYGLTQVSLESEGKEPSAAHMGRLIEMARREGIHTVLISREFDSRNAETLAREIQGKVIVFDPMQGDWLKNMNRISYMLSSPE